MKKAVFCILAGVLILAALSAAAEPSRCPYDIHLSILYNYLTDSQRTLYDRLYDAIRDEKDSVPVPAGMTHDEVGWMLDMIGNEYSELCAFDYGSTRIITSSGKVSKISIGYRMSIAEQDKFIKEVSQLSKQFANKTDAKGVKAIHDYLIKRFSYYNGDLTYDRRSLQSYYVLKSNQAVCNGYAQAAALLCHFAGYTCSYVTGRVADNNGEFTGAHAWNVALIDGRFSWFDVTWDDAGKKAVYGWYNLTGSEMGKTHRPEPQFRLFATLASILPEKVTCTMYLDVNDQNGYIRGVTDRSGKSYKLRQLKSGQYYAPAAVVWNNSSRPVPVTISYRIDGGSMEYWKEYTVKANSNLAFRSFASQLAGKRGSHSVIWYCNGNRLGTFTWKTE